MNLAFAPFAPGAVANIPRQKEREVAGMQGFLNVRLASGTGGLVCLQATRSSYLPSPGPQESLGKNRSLGGRCYRHQLLGELVPPQPHRALPASPPLSDPVFQSLLQLSCLRACMLFHVQTRSHPPAGLSQHLRQQPGNLTPQTMFTERTGGLSRGAPGHGALSQAPSSWVSVACAAVPNSSGAASSMKPPVL